MKLKMSQREYAASIVEEYKQCTGMPAGRKLRYVSTPMCTESLAAVKDKDQPGERAHDCAKWNGKLLYLARMTRGDLSTAISRMSRHLSAWSRYADCIFLRIMQYLEHHTNYHLEYTVEVGAPWLLNLMADADHCGDPTSSKSTTGWIMYVRSVDPNGKTSAATNWSSKRQGATAWSSGESE